MFDTRCACRCACAAYAVTHPRVAFADGGAASCIASPQLLHTMPPRRSDELEAAAAPAGDPFAALPHALALALFALLPVDQRMRCAEVCRGWRAMLSDVSLWLRLDFSPAGGVARDAVTDALVRAAAARAAGGLQALDTSQCGHTTQEAVCAVAADNAGALVELRMATPHDDEDWRAANIEQFKALLRAAPLLRVLEADMSCWGAEEATCVLRNEAPFGPLRIRTLHAFGLKDAAAVRSLAEHAAAHASFTGLDLNHAPLNEPAALDAVVDMALQCRLTYLELYRCGLSPASAPALAHLWAGGALKTLALIGESLLLLDEPAAVLLGNALRANTTLTSVTFKRVSLFSNAAAAAALLGALMAHPSLEKLDISDNSFVGFEQPTPAGLAAAGAPLGALVAANAPALRELRLEGCYLADAGLGPLLDALAGNTHLRVLQCNYNGLSEAFKRERLLPAVRANAWLKAKLE